MALLKRPWLRGLTAFLGVLFAVFAFFQLNDTNPEIYHKPSIMDAWSWGFISVLCFVSIFRSAPRILLILAAAFCIFEMVRTGPGLYANLFEVEKFTMTGASMAPSHSEVELSREFFGALIGLFGVGFLWWQATQATRNPS